MTTVTVEEAQTRLSQPLHELAPGEEILITEGRRPLAKLVGQGVVPRKTRQPGGGKGKLIILEDDDEHLKISRNTCREAPSRYAYVPLGRVDDPGAEAVRS